MKGGSDEDFRDKDKTKDQSILVLEMDEPKESFEGHPRVNNCPSDRQHVAQQLQDRRQARPRLEIRNEIWRCLDRRSV